MPVLVPMAVRQSSFSGSKKADAAAPLNQMVERVIARLPDLLSSTDLKKMVTYVEWVHTQTTYSAAEKDRIAQRYTTTQSRALLRAEVEKVVREVLGLTAQDMERPEMVALVEAILGALGQCPAFRVFETAKTKMLHAARGLGQVQFRRNDLEKEPLVSNMPFALIEMKIEELEKLDGYIENYRNELEKLKQDYQRAIEKFKKPIRQALQAEGFTAAESQGVADEFTETVLARQRQGKPLDAHEAGQCLIILAGQKKPLDDAAKSRLSGVVEKSVKDLASQLADILERSLALLTRVAERLVFLLVNVQHLQKLEKKIAQVLKNQKEETRQAEELFQRETQRWLRVRKQITRV